MKSILAVSLAFWTVQLFAVAIESRIHSYDQTYHFLKFENGRVAFLNKNEKSSTAHFEMMRGQWVRASVDDNNDITAISILPQPPETEHAQKALISEPPLFVPTILPDFASVQRMYDRLTSNYKRLSECTDRAHVWAYDEFKNHGINSQKIFAFFTASYIDRNHFKWWFHVAPMVLVNEGGKIQRRVLDHRYQDRPVLVKEWTDLMVFSKRNCKETTKFSEYDVNPQTEDCYLIYESMYYRIPSDIHKQELQSQYRDTFLEHEVKTSRNFAFDNQTRVQP